MLTSQGEALLISSYNTYILDRSTVRPRNALHLHGRFKKKKKRKEHRIYIQQHQPPPRHNQSTQKPSQVTMQRCRSPRKCVTTYARDNLETVSAQCRTKRPFGSWGGCVDRRTENYILYRVHMGCLFVWLRGVDRIGPYLGCWVHLVGPCPGEGFTVRSILQCEVICDSVGPGPGLGSYL